MATEEHIRHEIVRHVEHFDTWLRHQRVLEFYSRLEEMARIAGTLYAYEREEAIGEEEMPNLQYPSDV